MLQATYTWPLH